MANGHGGKRKGAGRKIGANGKINKLIREAVLEAADNVGSDGKGKGGMVGYLQERAIDQPQAFMGLLGRAMPMQVEGSGDDGSIEITVTRKIVRT